MGKLIDLTGQRFGRLTVIRRAPPEGYRTDTSALWVCRCDCGNEKIISGMMLRNGRTRSCGCLRSDLLRARHQQNREAKKMAGRKINPRRTPATGADVKKAWERGVLDGVSNASAIFLTVLVDKFGGADYIRDVWLEINKLSAEVAEKRVSVPDLRRVLLEEYGIEV